jgi:hypothetical protein
MVLHPDDRVPQGDQLHVAEGSTRIRKGAGDRALSLLKITRRAADDDLVKRAPVPWLGAIVAASFLVRTVLAWLRATPAFFPDEYLYTALGRSLAESGRPLIRGGPAHFPALLQPLLTAPAWLIGNVDIAYRVVQAIGALSMSLAAVPVYLLARRLGIGARVALALSALAALVPDLVYSSYISAEALAYPLVLAAVYAATRALARPTRKAQLGFVALAALATLARVQFAVLPLIFALTAVALGARERRLRATLREHALPLGLFAIVAAAGVASGPAQAAGAYRWLLDFHAGPLGVAHWAALDAMTLAYAAGWIVVPGALIGLWLASTRPRSRDELAFGLVSALLGAALLLEAGFLQASLPVQGREIQERYVFYAVPLIGICFALYASRGWPLRIPHLVVAAALVVVSVRLPLSAYAITATMNGSPVLFGVHWLGGKLARPGDAAAVVAAAVGLMSGIAVLASRRPRLGTPVVLGLAVLATSAASAGAVALDLGTTQRQRKAFLPADRSWVDHAHVGHTSLLQSWGGLRAPSLQELFWTRSIDRVLLLPDADPIDGFRNQRVTVGKDGSLFAAGRPVSGPLLVDDFGSTVRLRGARMLEAGPTATLWVPTGRPRLSFYATGRWHDGWLALDGEISVWPETVGGPLSGRLSMRLASPGDSRAGSVVFRLPGGRIATVDLQPGTERRVNIAVCATGSWRATYRSTIHRLVGVRLVSVRATAPMFRPGPSGCPTPPSGSRASALLPITRP